MAHDTGKRTIQSIERGCELLDYLRRNGPSTIGTNTIIERSGPKIGLIVTGGVAGVSKTVALHTYNSGPVAGVLDADALRGVGREPGPRVDGPRRRHRVYVGRMRG